MKKVFRAKIAQDMTLLLPVEAAAILGKDCEIYLTLDPEIGTVTLSSVQPDVIHNRAILDQIATLTEEAGLAEYDEPVPESFLQRRGKGMTDGGGA